MGTKSWTRDGPQLEENTAKVVWKELNREDGQRRRERARIYGEIAQPRSHLLKERLIDILYTTWSSL
jgi:hypothetical protein